MGATDVPCLSILSSVIQTKSAMPNKGIDFIALLSLHAERLLSRRTTLLNAGGFTP